MSQSPPHIELIPSAAVHATLWARWRGQDQARAYNPYGPGSAASLADRMAREGAAIGDLQAPAWRWMVRAGADLIGTVSACPNAQMGTAELGYQLDQAHHGRGLGTRSVALLIARCFDHPRLRRLHATVAVDNHASRHILTKLGFTHEGTLRAHFLIEGVPTDECVYGLLRAEWTPPPAT